MKKFRFLLVVAVVLVACLALCLVASASDTVTADTYDQVYVGEYTSDELNSSGEYYSGEAYIVFGKVTGTSEAGVIVERYSKEDSSYANLLEKKYYHARDGRITRDGEFAIALFNLQDGYYKAYMVAGNYKNPTATGDVVTFSKGVATYTVKFYHLDGTEDITQYTVLSGGTAVPPELTREGFELMGWQTDWQSGGYGVTYASKPATFKNITKNMNYAPVWKYVGPNGDSAAPETFSATARGYVYVGANSASGLSADENAVAVMSFDVLEDATAVNGISDTYIGTYAPGNPPPYNYNTLLAWALYNDNGTKVTHCYSARDVSNVTRSTDNIFNFTNILKAGNSVQIVYSPYRSADKPGYLHAYVKAEGESEYTLYAGYENMTEAQAPKTTMPCFGTLGGFYIALGNYQNGIDTDGDYTTLETVHGLSAHACSTGADTARYVDIVEGEDYCLPLEAKYNTSFVANDYGCHQVLYMFDKDGSKDSKYQDIVKAADSTTANGSYTEMVFTVEESNLASSPSNTEIGFGMVSAPSHNFNWFSGEAAFLASVKVASASVTASQNSGHASQTPSGSLTTSANMTARQILANGNTVKVEMSWDTLKDDASGNIGQHNGYIRIYVKTATASEYTLAAEITGINCVSVAGREFSGGYPVVTMANCGKNWTFDMTVSNASVRTYTSEGVVTGERLHIRTGNDFNYHNAAPSVKSAYVTKYNPNHKYTVTFVDTDGNILDVQQVGEGDNVKINNDKLYKAGYDFVGFVETIPNIVASDLTFTAQYEQDYGYRAQMASNEQTSSQALVMADTHISAANMAIEAGRYFEMRYTVADSNVDECVVNGNPPRFGFGFCHASTMLTGFSGRHGYGMTIGWTDGAVVAFGGPAGNSWFNQCDIKTESFGVGMKTLLTKGTTVKVITVMDTTVDNGDTGYTEVWYKTAEMADYAIAARMTAVGQQVAIAQMGGYAMIFSEVQYESNPWRIDIDFESINMNAYDAQGNVIVESGIQTGSSFTSSPNKVTQYNIGVTHTVTFLGPNGEVLSTQQVLDGHDAVKPSDYVLDAIQGYDWVGFTDSVTDVRSDITVTSEWIATQKWTVKQATVANGTGNENSIIMSNTAVNRDNLNGDQGEKFEMSFTVVESNADEFSGSARFGFGFSHTNSAKHNWSGTHCYVMTTTWDGKTMDISGGGNGSHNNSGFAASANRTTVNNEVSWATILSAGTQVKGVVAYDLTDDGVDTGKIEIWYKTSDMDSFALAAGLYNIAYSAAMTSNPGLTNHYPLFVGTTSASWTLNMDIQDLTFAAYDANGNHLSFNDMPITDSTDNGVGNSIQEWVERTTATITFVDAEGNVLDVQEVQKGQMPTVNEVKFEKIGYDFVGFDIDLEPATEDTTYVVQYELADHYRVKMSSAVQSSQQSIFKSSTALNYANASVQAGNYVEMKYSVISSNVDECATAPKYGFAINSGAKTNTSFSSQYGYGFTLGWTDGTIAKDGGASTSYNADIVWTDYDVPMKTLLTAGTTVKFKTAFDTVDDGVNEGLSEVWYKTEAMDDYALAATMTNVGYVAMAHRNGYPMLLNGATGTTDTYRLDMKCTISMNAYDSNGEVIQALTVATGSNYTAAANVTSAYDPNATHTVTFVGPNGEVLDVQQVKSGDSAIKPSDYLFDAIQGYAWDGCNVDYSIVTSDLTVTSDWTEETTQYTIVQGSATTGNDNSILMSKTGATRSKMNADDGSKFVMSFTVVQSNADSCTATPVIGFGFAHQAQCKNNWSGTHGWGASMNWNNGTIAFDAGNAGTDANGYTAESNGVGMKTILSTGTQVRVEMAMDLSNDDVDSGYIAVYYKTADMDDFALASKLSGMSQTLTLSSSSARTVNYPLMFGTTNTSGNWRLNMTIGDLLFACYDANGNRTEMSNTPITDSSDNGISTTVTAHAPLITRTVTFIGPDGQVIGTQEVQNGTALTVNENIFNVPKYTWAGYDGEYDFTNVTSDMTVYSLWTEKEKYTLEFWALDGTDTIETIEVYEGETITPPAFVREGYEFTGWTVSKKVDGAFNSGHRDGNLGTKYATISNVTEDRKYAAHWKWVGIDGTGNAPTQFRVEMKGAYAYLTSSYKVHTIPAGDVAVMSFDVLVDAIYGATSGIGLTKTGTWHMLAYNGYTTADQFIPYLGDKGTMTEYSGLANATQSTSVFMTPNNVLKAGKSVMLVYKPYESDTNPGWYRAYVKDTGSEGAYTLLAGWENLNATQASNTSMPCFFTATSFAVSLQNFNIGIDADGDYTTTNDCSNLGIDGAVNHTSLKVERYVTIDAKQIGSAKYGSTADKALMMVANKGTANEGSTKVEYFKALPVGSSVTFDMENGNGLQVMVGDYTLNTANYISYKLDILNDSIVLKGWNGTEYVTVDSKTATISDSVKFAFLLKNSESKAKQVFIDNVTIPGEGLLDFNYYEAKESEIYMHEVYPGKFTLTNVGYSNAYIPQDDFVLSFYDVETGETIETAYYGYGKSVQLPEGYALIENADSVKVTKVEADAFIALKKASSTLNITSGDRAETLYASSTYAISHDDSAIAGANDYVHYFKVEGFNVGDKVKVTMDVNVASTSESVNGWSTSVFKNLGGERIDDALPVDTDTKLTYETRVVSTANGNAVALTVSVDGVLNMTVKNVSITDSKLTATLLGGATLYMLPNDKDISNEQMESFVLVTASGKVIVMDGGTQKDYTYLRNFLHSITDKVDAWFISHYHEDHIGAISILLNQKDIKIDKLYYDFIDHETFWGPVVDESIVIDEDFGFESYEEMYAKGLGSDAGNSGTILGNTLSAIYKPKYGTSTGVGSGWMYILFYDEIQKDLARPVQERLIGEVVETKRGDEFKFDDVVVRVLNDVQNIGANFGNNTTINYRFSTAGEDILFLGDSGWQVGDILLGDKELIFDDNGDGVADSSVYDNLFGCKIIQAAHHGQQGVSESFYNEIGGDIYIYCAPEDLFYQDAGTGFGSSATKCLTEREWQRKMGGVSKTYWMDGLVTIR